MKLTPFAKLFITVVILGVLGYAFWHYKGADVKQWAVGDKAAAPAATDSRRRRTISTRSRTRRQTRTATRDRPA